MSQVVTCDFCGRRAGGDVTLLRNGGTADQFHEGPDRRLTVFIVVLGKDICTDCLIERVLPKSPNLAGRVATKG